MKRRSLLSFPVEKGTTFDLSASIEKSRIARKKKSDEVFAEMQKKYFGTFDTRLPCNCGKANISDHAVKYDANWGRHHMGDFVIGPGPYRDPTDKIREFKVFHAYWCDICGAKYKTLVIEGSRKYVPLELRPSQKGWRTKKLLKIQAL